MIKKTFGQNNSKITSLQIWLQNTLANVPTTTFWNENHFHFLMTKAFRKSIKTKGLSCGEKNKLYHKTVSYLCRCHNKKSYLICVEFSKYYVIFILIFFNVQNWDSQQGRDSCLKTNIYYVMSSFWRKYILYYYVIFWKFENSTCIK